MASRGAHLSLFRAVAAVALLAIAAGPLDDSNLKQFATVSLFAAPACAQQVVPAGSEIAFTSKQMGVPVDGRFRKFDAQVAFDPKKPDAAKVAFTIDLASISLGTPEVEAILDFVLHKAPPHITGLDRRTAQRLTRGNVEIERRLDGVAFFLDASERREFARDALKRASDLERSRMRLSLRRGGPRDLAALAACLSVGEQICADVSSQDDPPEEIASACAALTLADKPKLAAFAQQVAAAPARELPVPQIANIVFGGSGANRTVTVTPAAGQTGTAEV